jgi:uncharacterized membrane protein YoaK (UPF0700 family)
VQEPPQIDPAAKASPGQSRYKNAALGCLSVAAGGTDALTFLELGDLFTSAMTGNVALLAIAIGRGEVLAASRSFTALLAFAVGVGLATATNAARRDPARPRRGARQLLVIELVLLLGSAALWSGASGRPTGIGLYAVIVLSAMSMGIQAVGARALNSFGVSTIVFTTALIEMVTSATRAAAGSAGGVSSGTRPHLGAFAAYAGGAVVAAFLVSQHLFAAIWIPTAAVVVALGLAELASKREQAIRVDEANP